MNVESHLMKRKADTRVFKISTEKIANPFMRAGVGLTRGLIEHTLCFSELNRIYADTVNLGNNPSLSFARRAMQAINVTWKVHAPCANPIPVKGPVVLVANHPFGGIEGLMLISLLQSVRPDAKVMANYLLERIPELREAFFFVDPFDTQQCLEFAEKCMHL